MRRALVDNINAYLVHGANVIVREERSPISPDLSKMTLGSTPTDGGHLLLSEEERVVLIEQNPEAAPYVRRFIGADDITHSYRRYCLWIEDVDKEGALKIPFIRKRVESVRRVRLASRKYPTKRMADLPHRFADARSGTKDSAIVVVRVSSENRPYIISAWVRGNFVIGDRNFALYDPPIWNLSIITSRVHRVWIGTVCVRMRNDLSYSSTMGWNTFPIPKLTETDRAELTESAERILRARDRHPSLTLGQLYKEEAMPDDLREAHARNDQLVERIIAGKEMSNDAERLRALFALYERMTSSGSLFA